MYEDAPVLIGKAKPTYVAIACVAGFYAAGFYAAQ
jgi:hypothetical protein